MPSKPSNWYSMGYDERRAWEKNARAIEDAEYEADRARVNAEQADRRAREQERELRAERARMSEEADSYAEQIDALESDLKESERVKAKLLAACKAMFHVYSDSGVSDEEVEAIRAIIAEADPESIKAANTLTEKEN